ncbi:capsular biosynthesis protein [Echinicola strongylocentroti]|uniref:protein-tyrosine-phosphatase n=1 Tax=Echinicola strongylocentroti TaxID=1795355 RepID=A0A2Z4IIT3_9BACT|nr:CpsB/CapC family capsule biosynthesis tyrosine phosphatase [Echinicola strongylocentroti]AWW30854.1 capsular biosynthesis protein [Echinicola strongylocentroti]
MGLLDLFKSTKKAEPLCLKWMEVDMHSHLIPGIDDGSQSLKESIALIKRLESYGLRKLITTPHVMTEFYKNTPEIISEGLTRLHEGLDKEGVKMDVEAAAEYYLDEVFVEKLEKDEPLLTFGDNYILVETGFMNKPRMLQETFFALETKGYKPILAHPERYLYLHQDPDMLESLIEKSVTFQVNLLSFTGYYSKPVKVLAEKLLERRLVRFVGTDCHNNRYLDSLESITASKSYQKLKESKFMNSLL